MEKDRVNLRPDDRLGVRPGTLGASIRKFGYRAFSQVCHILPNFRGKVRAANTVHAALGVQNQHILTRCQLRHPVPYRSILDAHSWHERLAFLNSGYEPDTTKFLARLFNGKGAFVDVGANIGLISIPFAKLVEKDIGRFPAVFCIEAIDANARRLKENISINELEKYIEVFNVAVGDEYKKSIIQIEGNLKSGAGTGTANILSEKSDHDCERIELDVETIDGLISSGKMSDNCSLMKIDVDGYDLKVLQGSTDLLKNARPIIFGEFSDHCMRWHNQSHEDVVQFCNAIGYHAFLKIDTRFQFIDAIHNNASQDLLLVPEERLKEVSWCLLN
jgi:FkbM family methyltransferase